MNDFLLTYERVTCPEPYYDVKYVLRFLKSFDRTKVKSLRIKAGR